MSPPRIVLTGSALRATTLLVVTADTRTWEVSPYEPNNRVHYHVATRPEPWSADDVPMRIVSVTRYRYPGRDRRIQVALSNEGYVGFFGKEEGFYEKIQGAGLNAEDARGWGYLNAIRQIGERLFACGQSGQVYERAAPGDWRHIDAGVLNTSAAGADAIFDDVNGPHEDSLYLVGEKGAAYYRGKGGKFTPLGLPTSAWLKRILVADERTIYLAGKRGTILRGNHVDGFTEVAAGESNETFLSMAMFEDRLHLATATGVYFVDRDRLVKVKTTLTPDLVDGHVLDVVDGVLWSIGYEDIARFDGESWERLDLPGNPPIR